METKADIRKRILKLRQEQPLKEQDEKSLIIQKKVLQNVNFQKAEWVFLYMDCKAEVQTGYLLEQALRLGKRIVLPKVEDGEMDFYEITSRKEVQPGYYGILEPVTAQKVEVNHGFMAVPGVAFSRDRYRLGYGKGFYDRYLMRFPNLYTCGLAYECQIAEHLPVQGHDIRLKEIIYA